MTVHSLRDPNAVAKRGQEIYREKYQSEYETRYHGKFVVIDIATGEASVADSSEEAFEDARQKSPQGVFYLLRVGFPAAYRVG